ncbi:hypothetical protein AMECASPLE_038868 [Ameca splendens]|uniref:Uncharacterized protein n=1 Tax=Ameca splendens TaxID=208324 RepID=A0ABV0YJZ8_9TELE
MPLPVPCVTPLALELDSVSVPGFTPQPSHWFIQPEPAWLSSPPGLLSRGQSQRSVFLAQLQLIPLRIWISRQSNFGLLGSSSLTVWIISSSGFCASFPDCEVIHGS